MKKHSKPKSNRALLTRIDEVNDFVDEFLRRAVRNRAQLERKWFTSVMFDRGYQWMKYDGREQRFQKIGANTGKQRVIRCTTNKIKEAKNTLVSVLIGFDPRVTYAPQTATIEDQHTAQLASRVMGAIEVEWEWERKKAIALPWMVLTGGVFFVAGFDRNQGTLRMVQEYACVGVSQGACTYVGNDEKEQFCPVCADKNIRSPLQVRTDADGVPVEVPHRNGRMTLEVATHFDMYVDPAVEDMHDQETVIRIHRRTRSYVAQKYGLSHKEMEELEQAGHTTIGGETVRYKTALASYMASSSMEEELLRDKVDIVEAWHRPSRMFPKGFHTVRVGRKILYINEYPYVTTEGRVFSNIVYIPYEREPGSFYGTTPLFSCLELQRTRNRLESLILMAALRMGSPIWIMPEPGARMQLTGAAGLVVKYPANSPTRPVRDEGVPVPPSLVVQLQNVDSAIYNLIGIGEISRGQRPLSVRTHSALEKLDEVSRTRQSGLFHNYTLAVADLHLVGFELFRMVQPQDRYTRISGGNTGAWTVQQITNADIAGGIDVTPEPGGTYPRTTIERQALLTTFMQSGLIQTQDPAVVENIYRLFGVTELLPTMSKDIMQIVREHDRFRQQGMIQRTPWDNDALHSEQHREYMLTEEFEELDPQLQQMFMQHKQEHDQILAQQQQQELQQQAALAQAQLSRRK